MMCRLLNSLNNNDNFFAHYFNGNMREAYNITIHKIILNMGYKYISKLITYFLHIVLRRNKTSFVRFTYK